MVAARVTMRLMLARLNSAVKNADEDVERHQACRWCRQACCGWRSPPRPAPPNAHSTKPIGRIERASTVHIVVRFLAGVLIAGVSSVNHGFSLANALITRTPERRSPPTAYARPIGQSLPTALHLHAAESGRAQPRPQRQQGNQSKPQFQRQIAMAMAAIPHDIAEQIDEPRRLKSHSRSVGVVRA